MLFLHTACKRSRIHVKEGRGRGRVYDFTRCGAAGRRSLSRAEAQDGWDQGYSAAGAKEGVGVCTECWRIRAKSLAVSGLSAWKEVCDDKKGKRRCFGVSGQSQEVAAEEGAGL
jgi:hypothetical protein